ncbi:MAG: amino acid/amide transporter substrate-binding protein, family [Deltaproteobacteria bacterium]|jgi:branched-chain amino acid transport system substrate-binding protein|nr:amino acid/amide transporter substrate-binding protein, family [Deltaproteobacteria bacterium]
MKNSVFCLSLILFSSLLLLSGSLNAGETVKIGIVDTYTGPASEYTLEVLNGFKAAVDKINAKGGVLGKKIEFITRDDQFKVNVGLTLAKDLISKEKVDVLMGTINSEVSLAISDLTKTEKIAFFVTLAKSSKIVGEKGHKYVFGITENAEMAGRAAAVALAKKPFVRYWIAGDDYEYGHSIADATWNNLKRLNPKVQLLGQSWWKAGGDFTPYIPQIIAAKPDFLIAATGGATMINFQKAAKATGLSQKIPFYQHAATEHSTLEFLGASAPEGVYGTNAYFFYYPETPENKAFVEEYRRIYSKYPRFGAFYGYMAAQFIAEGFKKAGKMDTEKFIRTIEGMTLNSPVGPLTLRTCDHQLELPMYFGVTKKSPKYDFLIAGDIQAIPARVYLPSCAEIMQLRKK